MRRWPSVFLVILSCVFANVVRAQNDAPVFHVGTESDTETESPKYIREWLVIGPFFTKAMEEDFLTSVGGEGNVAPKEGDTVATSDGKTLVWKQYKSEINNIELDKAIPGGLVAC